MSARAALTGLAANGCRCIAAGFLGDAGDRATGGDPAAPRPACACACACEWDGDGEPNTLAPACCLIAKGAVGTSEVEAWPPSAATSWACCLPWPRLPRTRREGWGPESWELGGEVEKEVEVASVGAGERRERSEGALILSGRRREEEVRG